MSQSKTIPVGAYEPIKSLAAVNIIANPKLLVTPNNKKAILLITGSFKYYVIRLL